MSKAVKIFQVAANLEVMRSLPRKPWSCINIFLGQNWSCRKGLSKRHVNAYNEKRFDPHEGISSLSGYIQWTVALDGCEEGDRNMSVLELDT